MTQIPGQEPFPDFKQFAPPQGRTPEEITEMTKRIAAGAIEHPAPEPGLDATDNWLEETGGGGRKESLAVDPPRLPKRPPKPRRRGTKPGPNYSDDPRLEGGEDPNPQFTGDPSPEETAAQMARDKRGRELVERQRANSKLEAIKRQTGGHIADTLALQRARTDKK